MTKELTIKEMLEASRAEVLRLETLIEDKNAEIKHLNWLSGDLIKSFFDNSREIDKLERKLAQKLETAMISDYGACATVDDARDGLCIAVELMGAEIIKLRDLLSEE